MRKVGIVFHDSNWTGGQNYYKNLVSALQKHPNPSVELAIFCGTRNGKHTRSEFPATTVIETPLVDRRSASWILSGVTAKLHIHNPLLARTLERNGISILSHSFFVGARYLRNVKTIGWIPDFQHLHLPQFFSKEEVQERNATTHRLCASCEKLILSSEAAKADLIAFSPEHAHKGVVLQFVSNPSSAESVSSVSELQKKYNFEGRFFLLPNQFWAHKNHRLVVAALQVLKRRSQHVLILATGATADPRNPIYFDELMEHARDAGVLDAFRVLGKVPANDLVGLMRSAVAFINPSLFEGWSTSVEEAKSLGKTVLLSDIPVHREQSPELGLYFSPQNPETLADSLWNTISAYNQEQDELNQRRASENLLGRQIQFAENYQHIVERL